MKNSIFWRSILFLYICSVFFCCPTAVKADNNSFDFHNSSYDDSKSYNVLLLFSYSYNYPSFEKQMQGIRSVFDSADIRYDVEFLDAKRFKTPENMELNENLLSYKLKRLPKYDAILTCDEDALHFAVKNQYTLFKNLPIVFCAVNDTDFAAKQNENPLITGIAEVVSMKETVEMMHNMFPATNKVYAISDVTTQGTTDLGDYLELRADFPKLDLRYISLADYSYTQLPAVLKKIPADVPILYLAAYCDKEGVSLPFDKSVAYLNRYIKSPLFHLWEHGIKDPGMIGGKALSFFHQGRYAASLVMAILNGKDISKMKVMTKGNNAYMFNYNELMRFNVDMTTLPRNAVIFNEPESFIEKYKNIFIGMSFVICVLLAFILLLTNSNRRKKRMMATLMASREDLRKSKDVTDKTNTFFNTIIEQIPAGVFIKDPENNFDYVISNNQIKKFHNYDVPKNDDYLENKHLKYIFKEEDEQTMAVENRVNTFLKTVNIDGKQTIIRTRMMSFRTKDGHLWIIGLADDITKEEQQKRELINAKDKAEQADKLKSTFLGNMSHEIRTPLNAIVGFSNLLVDDSLTLQERQEYAKIINLNNDMLITIIDDILDLSKIQTKMVVFKKRKYDFSAFFNRLLDSLKIHFNNPDVEFIIDNPYKKCIICSDENRTGQIITNLITNSIKYTTKGHIKAGYEYVDNGIKIYVEDTGVGIDEKNKSKVFDRFEKLDTFTQGVGLGLAICKALVEQEGGKIDFVSTKGKGSTFWVWEPVTAEIMQ